MKNKSSSIFELFKLLQNEQLTQKEIQEKFNITKQTFYKYMKCYKDAGFDVINKNNTYSVNRYSKSVKLDNYDISLLANIRVVCENLLNSEASDEVQELIEKLLLMTDSDTYKHIKKRFSIFRKNDNYNTYREKINLFNNFFKKDVLVYVTIRSKGIFRAKPHKIIYRKNKVYFNFITEENKIKTILADRIVDIYPEFHLRTGNLQEKETIFELYGNLAKTYILREEEIIVDNFEGGIRIANSAKDKNLLFKRLLRYDTLCKIIHPESDKIKFRGLIDLALKNIDKV